MTLKHDPFNTDAVSKDRKDSAVRSQLTQANADGDLAWLMSDKRGRRVVQQILDDTGVNRSSFNTNSMSMAFAEGARSFGLNFQAAARRAAPEHFTTMLAEATK